MEVLCFGIAKDIIGSDSVTIEESINTVEDLRNHLNAKYPEFKDYTAYRIAINQAFANEQDGVTATDEIAIIPPVSGG